MEPTKYSWFPPANWWATDSLNHGQWSTRAKQWFRCRINVIFFGDLKNNRDTSHLVPIAKWKNKLNVLKSSKAIHHHI